MAEDISALMRELNSLVESRTFTAEAAGGVAKLREQALKAEQTIADLNDELKKARASISALEGNNAKLNVVINTWQSREAILIEREATMTALEKDLAVANAKAGAFDEINKRMLANRIMREDIYHSTQVPIPTQHGSHYTASQTETKQRTLKDEA